ncbi:hypothetical protein B1A99_23955 [Cohnella sp. CIP 111063]|uniref:response regulator transcription factor n=1 Tax=unclassified Cohnella TaxID=2636738 RepID=UPI000B8C3610|nr:MULTISPECIES: response regulator [unclassified Cohnella]OXS55383.1 hypothetical protein B1A99_23955 [Cohnella sp. CIP 111063]
MLTLLIVDDEPIIADGLYEEFKENEKWELDVHRAYSGKDALELISRMRIDLLISDIRMPGIDGIELLKQAKRHWPACKVVFLTGYKEFDYAYGALEHGAERYVLKTEGYDKIVEVVEELAVELDPSLRMLRTEGRAMEIVDKVKSYIEAHLHQDVSLVSLAEVVHFNPSYLSRFFKQQTGLNLSEYAQNVKVERAKQMLTDPNIKVNDIAEALGYGSSSNFTRSFKRITGLTPQDYRDAANR